MPPKSLKPWHRTWHKRTVRRALAAMSVGAFLLTGIGWATAPDETSWQPAGSAEVR